MTNDIQLRDYLLGRLPESDAERLEEDLIESEEVYLTLRTLEDDLFDEYARGDLDDKDRDAFLKRYSARKNRIAFAKALTHRKHNVMAFPPKPRLIGLAAAAALLVALGTILLVEDRRPRLSPLTIARTARQAGAPVVHSVAVTLTLGTSRSASDTPVVTVQPNTSTVNVRVRLHPDDRFEKYAAALQSSSGTTVWEHDDLHAVSEGGELILPFAVPAGSLNDGSYELAVHGGKDDLGFVAMEVRRVR